MKNSATDRPLGTVPSGMSEDSFPPQNKVLGSVYRTTALLTRDVDFANENSISKGEYFMSTCVEATKKKSTHKAEVVPVTLEKHPDADTLSVVRIWGYCCVVKTADWANIKRAVYIVPDSLLDVTRPEFAFLAEQANADGKARIKAKRLRGVVSYGLLIPAPEGAELGDDLAELLGMERYEPSEPGQGQKDKFVISGEEEAGPDVDTGPGHYDIDAFERYAHQMFTEGEPVVVCEKLDGSNVRFVYWDGRFWVKSRKRWVKRVPDYSHITLDSLMAKGVPEDKARGIVEKVALRQPKVNGFWEVLERTPVLMDFLRANPGVTVYGEVYGTTNRLKYGFPDGNRFAAFDIYRDGRFMDTEEAGNLAVTIPWVPLLNETDYDPMCGGCIHPIPYSFDTIKTLAEGKTTALDAKTGVIREGVVIKPLRERWDRKLGRVILKCVSPDFLSMK
jgi:RNA ligase (TIGR02306 family)